MAITQNPLIGRTSGKFAGAIFSTVHDKNIIRSKPITVRDAKTDAQLAQREKFNVAQTWIKMFLTIIRSGFANYKTGMSAYAAALGYYMKNCITGSAGSFTILYSAVKFTMSDIASWTASTDYSVYAASQLSIMLTNIVTPAHLTSSDEFYMLVYNVTQDIYVTYKYTGIPSYETIYIDAPNFALADVCQIYLFAQKASTGLYTSTHYAGSVVVES